MFRSPYTRTCGTTAIVLALTLLFGCGGNKNTAGGSRQSAVSQASSITHNASSQAAKSSENISSTASASSDATRIDYSALSSHEIVARMGTGINLGNTLDAPNFEGEWALSAKEHFFNDYKAAGFQHVRIPVTWHAHTKTAPPYTISEERLARAEQLIDWALAAGLLVIINAHHEHWLKKDSGGHSPENLDRLDAIWQQITTRFKHKPRSLVFEMLNEPEHLTVSEVDAINTRVLNTIRASNPDRPVVFAGNNFSSFIDLMNMSVPNDPNIIANFHSYDPWPFAGACTQSWGSEQDRKTLSQMYLRVADWRNTNGIPVTVNEFGVAHYDWQKPHNICTQAEREEYLKAHVLLQKEFKIPGTLWDDGGAFGLYDRTTGNFDATIEAIFPAP